MQRMQRIYVCNQFKKLFLFAVRIGYVGTEVNISLPKITHTQDV